MKNLFPGKTARIRFTSRAGRKRLPHLAEKFCAKQEPGAIILLCTLISDVLNKSSLKKCFHAAFTFADTKKFFLPEGSEQRQLFSRGITLSSMLMDQICIVIPFYNETTRFPVGEFLEFTLRHPETSFCLVNDGSRDATATLLESLRVKFPDKIVVCNMPENKGKAEAVRSGMLAGLRHFASGYFGYFDADLSAPLEEAFRLRALFQGKPSLELCFGSRIAIVGATIDRKLHRHFIGRILATCISGILHLAVYDTQCGAKLFRRDLAEKIFEKPFISRWLFDVEIMARIIGMHRGARIEEFMVEVPVSSWIDKGKSMVSWTYGFKVFFDLYCIYRNYKILLRERSESPNSCLHHSE
jgi:dolichyl-phosphate beta-glucosyltransferase